MRACVGLMIGRVNNFVKLSSLHVTLTLNWFHVLIEYVCDTNSCSVRGVAVELVVETAGAEYAN